MRTYTSREFVGEEGCKERLVEERKERKMKAMICRLDQRVFIDGWGRG